MKKSEEKPAKRTASKRPRPVIENPAPPCPSELWAEVPVGVEEFTLKFLGREYFPRQLDFLRAATGPDPRFWDTNFKEIVLMWGMGSGKDFTAQALVVYTIYKLLCMKDPGAFFGVETIDIVNVSAVNELQAGEVFFRGLKQAVMDTIDPMTRENWFQARGMDIRSRFGDLKSRIVRFPGGITARCFGSKETAPEGLNIFLGIMDEPSRAARARGEYLRVKSMYRLLRTNSASRFGVFGKTVLISYPQARTWDLTVERYEAGLNREDVLVDKASTPEVNLKVTDRDFDKEREEDPRDLMVRVYCQVPDAVNPLIQDPTKLEACVGDKAPSATVETVERMLPGPDGGQGQGFVALKLGGLRPDRSRPHYIHVDYGLSHASTAVVMAHGQPVTLRGKPALMAVIDLILEWRPKHVPGLGVLPVDFLNVDEVVLMLCGGFWVRKVTADRWNSEHLLQRLGAMGVEVEALAYTMPRQVGEARVLRRLIENGLISFYRHERALRQIREMQLEGERLLAGPDAGKDLFDCIARVAAEINAQGIATARDIITPEPKVAEEEEEFNISDDEF